MLVCKVTSVDLAKMRVKYGRDQPEAWWEQRILHTPAYMCDYGSDQSQLPAPLAPSVRGLEIKMGIEQLMFSLVWQVGSFHHVLYISDLFFSPKLIALESLGLSFDSSHTSGSFPSYSLGPRSSIYPESPTSKSLYSWLLGVVHVLAQMTPPW